MITMVTNSMKTSTNSWTSILKVNPVLESTEKKDSSPILMALIKGSGFSKEMSLAYTNSLPSPPRSNLKITILVATMGRVHLEEPE